MGFRHRGKFIRLIMEYLCMPYRIKMRPEDFVFEELQDLHLLESGPYTCFELEKKDVNTLDAIHSLARHFRLNPDSIGFAGTKDKKAITHQYVTLKGDYKAAIDNLQNVDVKTSFKGYLSEPLFLGQLLGNRFRITARDVTERPKPIFVFVNYYGEQRFGRFNAQIGKHLILKDFEHAALLLLETSSPY